MLDIKKQNILSVLFPFELIVLKIVIITIIDFKANLGIIENFYGFFISAIWLGIQGKYEILNYLFILIRIITIIGLITFLKNKLLIHSLYFKIPAIILLIFEITGLFSGILFICFAYSLRYLQL